MWKDLGFIREIFFFLPKFFFISFSLIFFGGEGIVACRSSCPQLFFWFEFQFSHILLGEWWAFGGRGNLLLL